MKTQLAAQRLLLFAAFIPIIPNVSAQEAFRWKFTAGDEFDIQLNQTMSIDTAIDRRSVRHENRMQLDVLWVVEDVDQDSNATIRQVFRGVNVTIEMPATEGQQTFAYDSNDPDSTSNESKRLQDSFEPLLNQPIRMVMTPRGEITNIDIPQETLESLRQVPGSMQSRETFTPEALRDMFMHVALVFPDDPIQPEDTWTAQREFQLGPRTYTMDSNYQYNGTDDQLDVFTVNSRLSIAPRNDNSADEFEIVDQSSSGTIQFDQPAGFCQSGEIELKLTTQVPYRDMTVRSTVTTQQRFSVEKR